VTASAVRSRRPAPGDGRRDEAAAKQRPLIVVGVVGACFAMAVGLAVVTLPVVAGWIAAPHAGVGLPAVVRTAAALWLVGHHVGFTFRGAGRIGLLPLGLVVLPGALLWRAGRWVVRAGGVARLRHVGYAAVALAVPYAVLTAVLALASRSSSESSSVGQAFVCGLLLALAAGGLGGARALAPWPQLIGLLPPRQRSVVVAVAGVLAVLATAGAVLGAASLAAHFHDAATLQRALRPDPIGLVLLLLLQLGYLPNAVVWGIAYAIGPGFAFGTATVVAPTGSALAKLPALPMLAALPSGLHPAMPGWLEPTVLALPYLAGAFGGLLLVRAAPSLTLDAAPVWGLVSGVVSGGVLALLAAASGGPLGDGRLAAVGPSPWQVGIVSTLEIGVAAAVTAGARNYLRMRRAGPLRTQGRPASAPSARGRATPPGDSSTQPGHVIFVDPWAGDRGRGSRPSHRGPSALP
jgi:Family of unknown function (DUF6350)